MTNKEIANKSPRTTNECEVVASQTSNFSMTNKVMASASRKRLMRLPTGTYAGRDVGASNDVWWIQRFARSVVRARGGEPFDGFMGLVIALNALSIGMEIQLTKTSSSLVPALKIAEKLFLSIFVVELTLRAIAAAGPTWKKDLVNGWFIFDAFLVVVGVVVEGVVTPILESTSKGASMTTIEQFFILRIFRLLRLVRVLRFFEFFDDLWKLANGLILSAKTVISAVVLIFFAIYMFACLGFESVSVSSSLQADADASAIVSHSFADLPSTMLTLMRFVAMDSVSSIYEPLVLQDFYFIVFFGLCALFINISMMNLITAAIVNTSISQGIEDERDRRRKLRREVRTLTPEIEKIFDMLDSDGSGQLHMDELDESDFANIRIPKTLQSFINPDKMADLFEFLDMDNSGSIDKDEFVDGVVHLVLQNVSFEMSQTLQLLRSQQEHIHRIEMMIARVQSCVLNGNEVAPMRVMKARNI
jgi:hypothetical protein